MRRYFCENATGRLTAQPGTAMQNKEREEKRVASAENPRCSFPLAHVRATEATPPEHEDSAGCAQRLPVRGVLVPRVEPCPA